MDLIEALEKTKIKYPYLKTIEDFQNLLNKSSYSGDLIFKEAKDKLEVYLCINKETDDFDKFIKWISKNNNITEIKKTSKTNLKIKEQNPNAAVIEVIQRAYGVNSSKSSIPKKKSKKQRKTTKRPKIKYNPTNSQSKKPKGQRSMSGPYGKSGGMKGLYPSHCSTCGTKLPAQYIVNCPKCTRSIL